MISDIRNFPLPTISETNNDIAEKIQSLVKDIQSVIPESTDIDYQKVLDLQWEIDYWVFKLYGLDESDITIISEDFLNHKPECFLSES